jgi:hypothetical protein
MINNEYVNYKYYHHLYIDNISNVYKSSVEYGSNRYGNKDPKKLFRLIPHYNGDFGYSVNTDSLKIIHINKEKLSTFIYCLKNKINASITLIVDAMFPCLNNSYKQFAITEWKYENDYLYFTDYDNCEFSPIKVKLNNEIINNMEIIYDYHNDDINNAFNKMTRIIESFHEQLNKEKFIPYIRSPTILTILGFSL